MDRETSPRESLLSRKGRFWITHRKIVENPVSVARAFAIMKLLVVRAEMHFDRWAIEYMGYSPMFHPVEEGAVAPEYAVHITDDGNFLVEVEQVT